MAPAAAGEQVDRGGHERKQHRDQDELDRPSLDHARADVDVGGRALHELEPLVERPEEILGGAPDLAEPRRVESVVAGAGRPVPGRRKRDRGDST